MTNFGWLVLDALAPHHARPGSLPQAKKNKGSIKEIPLWKRLLYNGKSARVKTKSTKGIAYSVAEGSFEDGKVMFRQLRHGIISFSPRLG